MSKVDALRALREARYARIAAAAPTKTPGTAAGKTPTRTPAKAASPTPAAQAAPRTPAPEPQPSVSEAVDVATCGHRNMSGRACTREADHVKAGTKNHRYS